MAVSANLKTYPLCELIREDNTFQNETYVYEYDNAGNIRKKYTYALTGKDVTPTNPKSTYSYSYGDADWGDKLTAYRGQSFTYDEIGNPLSYYNGRRYTFTWENGRRLATAEVGENVVSFTYNDEGIRTSKNANGVKHSYSLNGSQIIMEDMGGSVLVYLYDASGSPIGMQYRNTLYDMGAYDNFWFEKNLQGDIVAVYNAAGTKLISYTYDAWGNFSTTYHNGCTASHIANLNPFRYRGYYYDSELGMYYLQSRYYDPVIGRWINADGVIAGTNGSIQGYNVYAYCFNNPINMTDETGTWPSWNDIKSGFRKVVDWVDKNIYQPVVGFFEDVVEDYHNYDSDNQSADVVFESNYFSNYKGAFVLKVPTDASFSFGFIGLSTAQLNGDTLNHEYGHILQFRDTNVFNYLGNVAIPSITINLLQRKGKLPYDYHSYPWEAEADQLGGVSRNLKNPLPAGGYSSYWDLIWLFFE